MSRPTSKKWGHSRDLPKRRGGLKYINGIFITVNYINGVWGNAPIGFPEGENRPRPGLAGGTGLGNNFKGFAFIKN